MKPNRSVPPATVVPVLSYPGRAGGVRLRCPHADRRQSPGAGEHRRGWAVIVAERRGGQPARAGGVTHCIRVRVEDAGPSSSVPVHTGHGCSNRLPIGSTASGIAPWRTWRAIDGSSLRPCGMWRPRNTAARRLRPGRGLPAVPVARRGDVHAFGIRSRLSSCSIQAFGPASWIRAGRSAVGAPSPVT
jgi:hypothetical protein